VRDRLTTLSALAMAVLDGEAIDWTRARRQPRLATSPLLESLQIIDGIANAARASRVATRPATLRGASSATVFVSLLVTLAAGHVIAAVVGYASGFSGPGPTAASLAITTVLVFTIAASWLGLGGRSDPRARSLAVFYLLIAAAFARRFARSPDAGVVVAVLRNASPDAFVALFVWRFVGQFPRTVRFGPADRVCRIAQRASLAAGLFLFTVTVLLAVHLTPWLKVFGRSHPAQLYWTINLGLTLAALPVAWWRSRLAPRQERRRVAIFTSGLLVGIAPMVADVLLEAVFPAFRQVMARNREPQALVLQVSLLSMTFITAYSVIVEQVFDVRLAVGRALQGVFARGTLTLLAGMPFVVLGVLAYSRRDLSLARLVSSGTGALMAALTVTGLVMWAARRRMLGLLSRRFLRPAADIARDLPQLAAAMRNAGSRAELGALFETRLATMLHATPVRMLMAARSGEAFIATGSAVLPLPVRSALGAIVCRDALPLPVGPRELRSCFRFLPPREQDWVCQSNVAVLTPLIGSHDTRVGLVAAGPREDGLPYTPEDLSFLTTCAPAAALSLEVHAVHEQDEIETAAECPRCGRVAATVADACECGSARRPATVPPVVAGKYRVERRIGAGGMGVVYKARDVGLDRTVALKTLPGLSPEAGERLRHEAQMMASVIHPNLATIFSLERWRNTPILVVEFLEGGTLAARIRVEPQPIEDVLRLGVALASALQHLHERRVLHGDLKPSNIAFSATGVPKLLDFGVARFLSAVGNPLAAPQGSAEARPLATQSLALAGAMVAGTPLYFSPEAARGSDEHDDFDLWALAVVLYEAIAGTHPFLAPTIGEVLDKVRAASVPPLQEFRPDCPGPVASAFAVMLSPRRSERPRSAGALLELLGQCRRRPSRSIDVG